MIKTTCFKIYTFICFIISVLSLVPIVIMIISVPIMEKERNQVFRTLRNLNDVTYEYKKLILKDELEKTIKKSEIDY